MPSHFQVQVLFTKTNTHRLAFYQETTILQIYAIHSLHIKLLPKFIGPTKVVRV